MKLTSILISRFTAISVGLFALTSFAADRPNVVFILTDDQRYNCLGLADDSVMSTPNIDRLGREGVYFRNAFYGFNKELRGYAFSPRGPYSYGPGFDSIWMGVD